MKNPRAVATNKQLADAYLARHDANVAAAKARMEKWNNPTPLMLAERAHYEAKRQLDLAVERERMTWMALYEARKQAVEGSNT